MRSRLGKCEFFLGGLLRLDLIKKRICYLSGECGFSLTVVYGHSIFIGIKVDNFLKQKIFLLKSA